MRIGNVAWSEVSFNNSGMNREVHVPLCERLMGKFHRPTRLFKGSPRGAKAGAIFYSLLATCRANQINPEAYLVKMLSQIRACKTPDDYRKLLPYNIEL